MAYTTITATTIGLADGDTSPSPVDGTVRITPRFPSTATSSGFTVSGPVVASVTGGQMPKTEIPSMDGATGVVEFHLYDRNSGPVKMPSTEIPLDPDTTISLNEYLPIGVDPVSGAVFIKGETGPQGDRGPRGVKGDTGDRGAEGPEGPQGEPGINGADGVDGEDGTGIEVKDTLDSADNLPETGEIGDTYLINRDLYVWSVSNNGWSNAGTLQGPKGEQGIPGEDGADGKSGADGSSAYGVAVTDGFEGTESEWLASLVGPEGPQGEPGEPGKMGEPGQDGEPGSAGTDGLSAYEVAVAEGFEGTESEFISTLVGPKGERGPEGPQGPEGPKGDKGSDGIGLPSGGDAGDVPVRTSDGGTRWGTVVGQIDAETWAAIENVDPPNWRTTIRRVDYKGNDCTVTHIHADGKPSPKLLHKYVNAPDAAIGADFKPTQFFINETMGGVAASVMANASGWKTTGNVGEVRGAQVVGGEIRHEMGTDHWQESDCLGMLPSGRLKAYSAADNGDVTENLTRDGVEWSVAFGPILIDGGQKKDISGPFWSSATGTISARHVLGQRPDGDILILAVPGKTGTFGLDLAAAADLAQQEGLEVAINLDAGGSTQVWANGSACIPSSDAGGESGVTSEAGRRQIPDAIYTTIPVVGAVPLRGIPCRLGDGMTTNGDVSLNRLSVIADGTHTRLSGQVKKTSGSITAGPTVLGAVPEWLAPKGDKVTVFNADGSKLGKLVVDKRGVISAWPPENGVAYATVDNMSWSDDAQAVA